MPAAGIVVARARTAWPPGLVIRRLPGWADSASDTIVTVRRRAWGQIWRFRRRVPLLHPAPERFDHGEQHSQDASQQERDSRRQVPVSAEGADVHTRWLFSRMKTSRSNNRTAHSAEATRTALTRVRFGPCCAGGWLTPPYRLQRLIPRGGRGQHESTLLSRQPRRDHECRGLCTRLVDELCIYAGSRCGARGRARGDPGGPTPGYQDRCRWQAGWREDPEGIASVPAPDSYPHVTCG